MLYSAIGSRNTETAPSTLAAATQVRSMPAASSPFEGEAMINPGTSRSTATELSLWKCPPNPFWYAYDAIRTTIGLAN